MKEGFSLAGGGIVARIECDSDAVGFVHCNQGWTQSAMDPLLGVKLIERGGKLTKERKRIFSRKLAPFDEGRERRACCARSILTSGEIGDGHNGRSRHGFASVRLVNGRIEGEEIYASPMKVARGPGQQLPLSPRVDVDRIEKRLTIPPAFSKVKWNARAGRNVPGAPLIPSAVEDIEIAIRNRIDPGERRHLRMIARLIAEAQWSICRQRDAVERGNGCGVALLFQARPGIVDLAVKIDLAHGQPRADGQRQRQQRDGAYGFPTSAHLEFLSGYSWAEPCAVATTNPGSLSAAKSISRAKAARSPQRSAAIIRSQQSV